MIEQLQPSGQPPRRRAAVRPRGRREGHARHRRGRASRTRRSIRTARPLDWLDSRAGLRDRAEAHRLRRPRTRAARRVREPQATTGRAARAPATSTTTTSRSASRASAAGSASVATRDRDPGGGLIDATIAKLPAARLGRTTGPPRLGGTIALVDLPLAHARAVHRQARAPAALASATLHLAGARRRRRRPPARVTLLRSWVAGAFVGDAQLADRADDDRRRRRARCRAFAIRGSALAGRARRSPARSVPRRRYPVELAITGRRIELDVAARSAAAPRARRSRCRRGSPARSRCKTELAPAKPVEPEAWIELSEVVGDRQPPRARRADHAAAHRASIDQPDRGARPRCRCASRRRRSSSRARTRARRAAASRAPRGSTRRPA